MKTKKRIGAVTDTSGRRYSLDAARHSVRVQEPDGRRWTFGGFGSGAGELNSPSGLTILAHGRPEGTRLFVADTGNHRIQVFDGLGRPILAFGAEGSQAGQFRGPSGVTLARPDLPWEESADDASIACVLVVADEGNDRVQVFDLDGAWLATIDAGPDSAPTPVLAAMGWPYFRIAAPGVATAPFHVTWRAPWLLVGGRKTRARRIDLAGAMLPAIDEWLATAPEAERAHARRYFALLRHHPRALPQPVARQVGLPAAA